MRRTRLLMPWMDPAGALGTSAMAVILLLFSILSCHAAPGDPPLIGNPGFSLSIGGHFLAEESMRDTYGWTPEVGLCLWTRPVEQLRFFVGVRYASTSGNPAEGDPTFESSMESKLEFLPLELGFEMDLVPAPAIALFLGFAGEVAWTREEVMGTYYADPGATKRYTGRGYGVRLLLGPEWQPRGERYALGLETSAGLSHADVRAQESGHSVNLSSLAARGYVAVHL
jgi:hypothetical protein